MVDGTVVGMLERLGFADILLWLLSFAVVYGILSQIEIPKQKPVRAIIGIVAAFFVLMATPASLLMVISRLSASLLVVLLGIVVLLVFLEVGGIKHFEVETEEVEKEGKRIKATKRIEAVPLFSKNPYIIAITFILIAILIFIGAGGLNLLGFKITGVDITGVIFLVAIIIAVLWMIKG
ncbi:MAG: hypothetical protein QW227_00025 [Candidatus Aenigmatarchaeota archaeon]|nr:hypothetical protein [Candidatus Aenigmarchaeota archaeon]